MNVGVSSYSFSQYMKNTGADIFAVISKAKELGFSSFEFTSVYAPEGVDALERAREIRAYCRSLGMPISAYTVYADFLKYTDMEERLQKEINIASALGAPLLRHDVTAGFRDKRSPCVDFEEALKEVVPPIRRVTERAKALGIRTMSENHGFFFQDSERIERLITAVDSDNYGALIDIGNFACVDEDSVAAVKRLAPYAFHVHVKDFFIRGEEQTALDAGWFSSRSGHRLCGTIVGVGDIPVDKCLRILREQGYAGNYSIEFEGLEENILALQTGLANLKRMNTYI